MEAAHQELHGQNLQTFHHTGKCKQWQAIPSYVWVVHLNGGEGSGAGGEASEAVGDHWAGRQANGALQQAARVSHMIMPHTGTRRHCALPACVHQCACSR